MGDSLGTRCSLAAACLVLLLGTASDVAALEFVERTISVSADGAVTVVAADVDGDGDPDVLSASRDDDTVAWYQNQPGPVFGAAQVISTDADNPRGVAAADLDGDGDRDVVVTWLDGNSVGWVENLGGGTFGSLQTIATGPQDPVSVVSGDVDGDGDHDLLVAFSWGQAVHWYENVDGAGGFGSAQRVTEGAPAWDAVLVDLDGDGDLDVAAVLDYQLVWVENADGAGTFAPVRGIDTLIDIGRAVAAVDFDGDGDQDLVSASLSSGLKWHENLGGAAAFDHHDLSDEPHNDVVSADVDGDTRVDLVVLVGDGMLVLSNDGAGDVVEVYENTNFLDKRSVATADLDGDGDLDLLSADAALDAIRWYENTGTDCNGNGVVDSSDILGGTSQDCDVNGVPDECDEATDAAADCNDNDILDECESFADCNADGIPDECAPDCNANLVPDVCDVAGGGSADCNGNEIPDECEPDCNANSIADTCDILVATSDDCTGNGVPDECEPDCNGNAQADVCEIDAGIVGDCDDDGIPDECEPDCDLNGVPDACDTETDYIGPFPVATGPPALQSFTAPDMDGDGDADVIASWSDRLGWYENLDGLGTFGPEVVVAAGEGGPVAVADLDGDGDLDVLSCNPGGSGIGEAYWHENLDGVGGAFGPRRLISPDRGCVRVVADDINGDGDVDVVMLDSSGGFAVWFENLGNASTFGAVNIISSYSNSLTNTLATADLDGDGDPDVIFGRYWVENLDGVGDFSARKWLREANYHFPADLDGDGDLDIVHGSEVFESLSWSENVSGSFDLQHGIAEFPDPGLGGAVVAADADGDGDVDVFAKAGDPEFPFAHAVTLHENRDGLGTLWRSRAIVSVLDQTPSGIVAADYDGDRVLDVVLPLNDAVLVRYPNGSGDCDGNGAPDVCDPDCSADGIPDACDPDCNGNLESDICDILSGSSDDCDGSGVPDECEPDCNSNDVADACDIGSGASSDCDGNGVPDECEPDCNLNDVTDACDIAVGVSGDCNLNEIPDECDVTSGSSDDCDGNLVPDECEPDCNNNGIVDRCDIIGGFSSDCEPDGIPDECDDCNANGYGDTCETAAGFSPDCDDDTTPDACQTEAIFVEHALPGTIDEPVAVYAVDVDGDGDADVVAGYQAYPANHDGDRILWFENLDGVGTFGPQQPIYLGVSDETTLFAMAVADLGADGDLDVFAALRDPDEFVLFENGGGGAFGSGQVLSTAEVDPAAIHVADLDGDGDVDLLTGSSGYVSWYENYRLGRCDCCAVHGTAGCTGAVCEALVCGQDSFCCLASWDQSCVDLALTFAECVECCPATTSGSAESFSDRQIIATSVSPHWLDSGDFDGDGHVDLLVTSNVVSLFAYLDIGHYGPPAIIGGYTNPIRAFARDLDGDRRLDVLVYDDGVSAPPKIAWSRNDGTGFTLQMIYESPSGPSRFGQVLPVRLRGDDDVDVLVGALLFDSTYRRRTFWLENENFGSFAPSQSVVGRPAELDKRLDAADLDGDGDMDIVAMRDDPFFSDDDIVIWYENMSQDCNGNRVPDACEADCNANGLPDTCDLTAGVSRDCNGNMVLDECETTCTESCDTDGDGCIDEVDTAPFDPLSCGDSDSDSCDDCSQGSYDPFRDGLDLDRDGVCDSADCDRTDYTAWAEPSTITSLRMSKLLGDPVLSWEPPSPPGAIELRYDTLRSAFATDFVGLTSCLESDDLDTVTLETTPSGGIRYYLVRVQNRCPGGETLGNASDGSPRVGRACP